MGDMIEVTKATDGRSAIDTNRTRSLDALHLLALRAGSATPGREQEWLDQVRVTLAALEEALETQQANSSTATVHSQT